MPLYFAKKRKVVERNSQLFLLDDDRFDLKDSDIVSEKIEGLDSWAVIH